MSNQDKSDDAGFGARLMSGLKDLILEEEVPARGASEAPPSHSGASASIAPPPLSVVQSAASPMTDSLMAQVLNRSTAYTAFMDAMAPLAEIIPDEMTRYRAAYAVIKKTRSLEQVVQAIDLQHMQALEDEVARFAVQAKEKEAADVDVRLNVAKTLKADIESADQEVIKLRQEMEARIRKIEEGAQNDRQRLQDIAREVEEKRQSIALVQRQFDAAATAVKATLLQARAQILKYLST